MDKSRREFIRKAGYAAPAVLTASAMPAIASTGSPEREIIDEQEAGGVAQSASWQSRERRRFVRRMRRKGIEIKQFGFDDWSRVDKETWTLKD